MHTQPEQRAEELATLLSTRTEDTQMPPPAAPAPAPAQMPTPVYHLPGSQRAAKGAGADVCDVCRGSAPQVRCCDCSRVVCRRCANASHMCFACSGERRARMYRKLQDFDRRRNAKVALAVCGFLVGFVAFVWAVSFVDDQSLSVALAVCAGIFAFSGPMVIVVQLMNIHSVRKHHTALELDFACIEVASAADGTASGATPDCTACNVRTFTARCDECQDYRCFRCLDGDGVCVRCARVHLAEAKAKLKSHPVRRVLAALLLATAIACLAGSTTIIVNFSKYSMRHDRLAAIASCGFMGAGLLSTFSLILVQHMHADHSRCPRLEQEFVQLGWSV